MFIIFEGVLTNIGLAERIYTSDPNAKDKTTGFRIEFEGGTGLGVSGKKYLRFDTKEQRDFVFKNIVENYATNVFALAELKENTKELENAEDSAEVATRKPGRPKGS